MKSANNISIRHNVLSWLPTLYVAEALPYVAVNTLTVLMYTRLGVDLATMTFYTGWLYLPWVIKPFWSPFVDIFSSKRRWVLLMELLMGLSFAGVVLLLPVPFWFAATLALFWLAAFFSATHDIAADGYYMLELTDHEQAAYVGVRSTFYRLGSLIASGALVALAGYWETRGLADGVEPSHGQIQTAWGGIMWVMGGFLVFVSLYHNFFMPKAASDHPRRERSPRQILTNFGATFATFFTKPGIIGALAFMLLYRLPEALCLKVVAPFLVGARAEGGLDLTTAQVGVANGITGVVGILIGGILGGLAIAHAGLRRWLWPMALSLALPCVVYFILALIQPEMTATGFFWVNVAIFVEQFGYGFGFTAFMLYLIYFSEGEWKTSHYAFCTAFMALGMMLPGMAAGWVFNQMATFPLFQTPGPVGYANFFFLVVVCTVFTCIACLCVKIDPNFGRKTPTFS